MTDPALKLQTEKHMCKKMICRKCYAKLNVEPKIVVNVNQLICASKKN